METSRVFGIALLALAASAVACGGSGDEPSGGGEGGSGAGTSAGSGGAHHANPGSILDGEGKVDCDAYAKLAGDYDPFIEYLSGPAFGDLHDEDSDRPTVYSRGNEGAFCFGQCTADPVDWSGYAGQVLLASKDHPGLTRARFSWSKHTGHGGAEYAHLYLLAPIDTPDEADGDSWFTSEVDPAVDSETWKSANAGAQLAQPVAASRGRISWNNNGIVAFANGLVGAAGSGNSGDEYPFVKLEDGKVPTDVAVTNNAEFALVTVWDTTACKGQVAVIALQQHDGYFFGLPNEGFLSGMKLLGYVDLPVAAPTRIAASSDFGLWMSFSSKDAEAELATQAGRDKWQQGIDDTHNAAKAGFALVASREENKVVALDLEPLFQSYRSMYMTTQAKYDQTTQTGPAEDEWPFAFSKAPEAVPTVAEVLEVKAPASLVTGFPIGDRSFSDIDFAKRAYVATVDGDLTMYDAGGLATEGPATKLTETSSIKICKNPTRNAYGRGGSSRDQIAFVCRGDRKVEFVAAGASVRVLDDSRMNDPVAVVLGDSRGAEILTVADFGGKKVLNYLAGSIDSWGEDLFGGLGKDGGDEFEWTASLPMPGKPFGVSSAQVP